ncbi:unnamed protein product [Durusdinium trenchii]|uniref:Uncharacterized protein n=1 Tax=Durusdinium trenchii TaxID=1381693 RepID=A0ABP0KXN2_9DINO
MAAGGGLSGAQWLLVECQHAGDADAVLIQLANGSYQLVFDAEVLAPFVAGTSMAQLSVTDADLAELLLLEVLAASGTRPMLDTDTSFSMNIGILSDGPWQLTSESPWILTGPRLELEAFENISEVILHLALLPLYAWPERLEPSETAGSLLLPALEIQLNVSDLESLPFHSELALDLQDVRSFFPTFPVVELRIIGEDVNGTELEMAAPVSCNAWWKPADPVAETFFGIRAAGRSGFGTTPFTGQQNQLTLRLVLPCVLRAESFSDVGLSLLLPSDFKCLAMTSEPSFHWAARGVSPHECRWSMAAGEAVYADQVLLLNLTYRNPSEATLTPSAAAALSLELRSRGELQVSEPWAMRLDTNETEGVEGYLGSVGVLGLLRPIVQPSSMSYNALNWLSVSLRPTQPAQGLVLDAPAAFDFQGCELRDWWLPRYEAQSAETWALRLPVAQSAAVRCVADRWPCPGDTVDGRCTRSTSSTLNRAHVQLQEKLVPGLLYGFDISVQNPATAATASENSFYIFTWDDGFVDGSLAAAFNPDRPDSPGWALYDESLQVNLSLPDARPFSLSGMSILYLSLVPSAARASTNLCITAPSGYVWGPPLSSSLLSRNCWAMASPQAPHCKAVDNDIRWAVITVEAGVTFSLDLEIQVPERLPLLGANAFFIELGFDQHWAAAAVARNDAPPGGPFAIQAIAETSVTCSCPVVGYEGNYLRFSARLPSLSAGAQLELLGDEAARGFGFQSSCLWRAPLDLYDSEQPFPEDTECQASEGPSGLPRVRFTFVTSQPSHRWAVELLARNPSGTAGAATWSWQIWAPEPTVLPAYASGCPLRRPLSTLLRPPPEPGLRASYSGRPGARNRIEVEVVPAERPSPPLQLLLRAPRGISLDTCTAAWAPATDATAATPVRCAGAGREALVDVMAAMEAEVMYVLQLAFDNPPLEVVLQMTNLWYFELGDEASLPLQGPRFQLLHSLQLTPLLPTRRTAPNSAHVATPVLVAFGVSYVAERLVLESPNFTLDGTCSLLEAEGPCEACLKRQLSWCAWTSDCGESLPCPAEYLAVPDRSGTHLRCRFRVRTEDLTCRAETPEGGSSSSRLLVELHQGGHFWPGRLYELHLLVAHGSEPQPNQSWRLKTESFKEESWHPVDVGEIVGYNLVPALEWNVTLAPSRLLPLRSGRGHCRAAVAGGSLGAVTISLQLGAAGVEDLFEIHPPKGITVASCDVTEVAPAEEEGIDVQMTSCGDPGALRLSWETETSVALSTEPPSISNGPENVSDTTTRAPPTQPETVVGANESGESRNESTTTEAPESQVNFSNESVNESATLRRMSSCGAQSDLSQCFQCHCGEECRLTFSGLQGADISFHVAIYQMEEKPVILWSEPWSITQKRADQVIAAAVAWQWPIRPSLRAAFSLGTGAAGDTQLALEITPRVVGANFTWLRLVAAWPPGFNFEGAHVQGATGATVLEASGPRLLLALPQRAAAPGQALDLQVGPVQLGEGGFSRFHAATLASEFVLEEVLNLTAFRIPGHVFVDNATLERVAPSRSTLPPLPVRLQEAGWLSMTFRLAQAVGPGTQLRLAASDAWELRAVGEGSGMSLYRVQDGQVAEILRLADVAAVSTMQVKAFSHRSGSKVGNCERLRTSQGLVQAVLLDPMASMSAYTVTLWAMPLTYEAPSSRGAWTLDLEDGDGPIVTSNEGFQLPLPAWPLPSIAVQLDMASPPPGGRTYVQLGVAPWIGAGQVHLLLEPPPGWRLGASTSPLVSLGFADLTGGWEAQFEASASLWTTTDTRWYLLATADVPIFSKGELLTPVLSWSHVDGANVAPMQTTIQHANLADLQSTELILTLRLDQETPVKSIRIQPPSTYGRLTCADPDGSLVRGAPRWPMSLRRFGPSCRDEDNRTEVLLAQPVPVGFWLISLSVALPDEDPPDLFRVEVYDENQRLVDAATQVTVPALSEHQHWPVREAPTMLLRNLERQAIVAAAVVELSFQVDQEMTVEQGKIKAMLISLPNSVQFDEGISMSITGLPLERGTPTVSLTQAIIRLLEPELLQLGRKRVRFGVLLPRTEPLENIWSLEICSQDSCGGLRASFPIARADLARGARAGRGGGCQLATFGSMLAAGLAVDRSHLRGFALLASRANVVITGPAMGELPAASSSGCSGFPSPSRRSCHILEVVVIAALHSKADTTIPLFGAAFPDVRCSKTRNLSAAASPGVPQEPHRLRAVLACAPAR